MDYWMNGYDQGKAIEWKINAEQAIFFSYLNRATRGTKDSKPWAKKIFLAEINRYMYSIAPDKFMKDLPHLKPKPTKIQGLFRLLEKKGLVEMYHTPQRRYFVLTDKSIGWGVARESNGAGTAPAKFDAIKEMAARGVSEEDAELFRLYRDKEITPGVIHGIENEAREVDLDFAEAIRLCIESEVSYFNADQYDQVKQTYHAGGAQFAKRRKFLTSQS